MKLDPKQFDDLEDRIRHKVQGIVDDDPRTSRLSEVARRNMANCAAWGAIGALTADEIERALTSGQGALERDK